MAGRCGPNRAQATNEWFRIYKIPAGSPENTFAFNGEAKDREFSLAVIKETHEYWKKLIAGELSNPKVNVYVDGPSRRASPRPQDKHDQRGHGQAGVAERGAGRRRRRAGRRPRRRAGPLRAQVALRPPVTPARAAVTARWEHLANTQKPPKHGLSCARPRVCLTGSSRSRR